MKGIKQTFKDLAIRQKIVTAYILLLLFPIGAILLLANSIYTGAALASAENNIAENSRLIGNQIVSVAENTESCSEMLNLSINSVLALLRYETAGIRQLKFYHGVDNHLDIARQMFPNIDRIVFADENGNIIQTGNNRLEETQIDRIKTDLAGSVLTKWYKMSDTDILTGEKMEPSLVLARKVIQIDTHEQVGILLLYVKEKTISAIYNSKYAGDMAISVTQAGRVVSAGDERLLFRESGQPALGDQAEIIFYRGEKEGRKKLFSEYAIGVFDWVLMTESDMNELLADHFRLLKYIIMTALLCCALSIACSEILAKIIVNPLKRLEQDMARVKGGDLEVACAYRSRDEIGGLALAFNDMVGRIKTLLRDVQTEQKQKREYEFSLVQAQIKPHFLYNTLDLIYVLCSMERSEEAGGMTKALADFYRVALSGGKEIIPLAEEISGVRNYLLIQKNRYSDIFDFSIDIAEELLTVPIPKLSIQPLVENAIYHGIKPAKRFGRVRISARCLDGQAEIRVEDDGVGSGGRNLTELLGESVGVNFGLRSVHERIRLYFGSGYGLVLNPAETGFSISILIPIA